MRMSSNMRRRSGETFLFCFDRLMTLLRLLRYETGCLIWQHTKQRNGAPSARPPAGVQRSHPYRASGLVLWPTPAEPKQSRRSVRTRPESVNSPEAAERRLLSVDEPTYGTPLLQDVM